MKKSLSKIVSLALVMAVLMTSMLVSSVGAVGTNPMQTFLIEALKLNYTDKAVFVDALETAEEGNLSTAAPVIVSLFNDKISLDDVMFALHNFVGIAKDEDRTTIKTSILVFSLDSVNYNGNNFDTIVSKVNNVLTGEPINGSYHDGVSLVIQTIEFLNSLGENGAYVTDLSSDTSKIKFVYDANDPLVALAKSQLSYLIDMMETLNNKISSYPGNDSFEKLLNYAASSINDDSNISALEITALKLYLDKIDDSYYIPYVAPSTPIGGGSTPPPVVPPVVTDDTTKAVEDLLKDKPAATATGLEANAFEKTLAASVQKAIEAVGTTTVTPTVTGTTAKITADQIKVADILAKADRVIAKAAELKKTTAGTDVTVEKKIVIDVAAKNVDKVDVALPTELLTKVQAKGIQTIEILTGDVKLDVSPDFVSTIKDSSSVSFQINKVAVTEELKANMNDEQKAILAGNATVYDFNFSTVSAEGIENKVTNFNKSITIKVNYSLKAGENKDNITVLYLADDGSIQNMVGKYDTESGQIIFVTNHFSTYVVKNNVITFKDIKSGAWYKSQAESLASKGIVSGVKGNNFAPNANITRAEFMTMLVKAKGAYNMAATCSFTDVSKDAWYYTYVASAVNAGITAGIGNNKFAPNSMITRQEMAVMLANALGEKAVDNANSYLTATDASNISAYAKNGMALCVKNEFMVGSDNKLDPKGNATRGMAAVVVYKYFNFIF